MPFAPAFTCSCCRASFPAPLPASSSRWTAERFDRFFADHGWTCSPRPTCGACTLRAATVAASRAIWQLIAPAMLRGVAAVAKPATSRFEARKSVHGVWVLYFGRLTIRSFTDARRAKAAVEILGADPDMVAVATGIEALIRSDCPNAQLRALVFAAVVAEKRAELGSQHAAAVDLWDRAGQIDALPPWALKREARFAASRSLVPAELFDGPDPDEVRSARARSFARAA